MSFAEFMPTCPNVVLFWCCNKNGVGSFDLRFEFLNLLPNRFPPLIYGRADQISCFINDSLMKSFCEVSIGPFPVGELRLIDPVLVGMVCILDDLIP